MTRDEIISLFRPLRPTGKELRAHCPAHEDRHPSLTLFEGEKKWVVKCRSQGCSEADIMRAVGRSPQDLFYSHRSRRGVGGQTVHPYRDEAGKLSYQVVRTGTGATKKIRQRRPDPARPGEYIWDMKGVRLVPYCLPELLSASSGELVFIPEGEKNVDDLRTLGCVATTNPGGAGKWRAGFNSLLKGRHVVVLPDADGPGRRHAKTVAVQLSGVAASVKLVELPGLAEKGDVSDWIADGGTRAQLEKLVAETKTFEPVSDNSHDEDEEQGGPDEGRRGNQTQRLLDLVQEVAEFFRTPTGEPFASVTREGHRETWAVRSEGFRRLITDQFFCSESRAPSTNAITDACNTLAAHASFSGAVREVSLRTAEHDGRLFVDLGSPSWRVVEISDSRWRVVEAHKAPVYFRRSGVMLPLPEPIPGGHIEELRQFLNVGGSNDIWRLLLVWLTYASQPGPPFPILVVQGEHGSAKSTTTKVLRALIDPSHAELRVMPAQVQELMLAAKSSWLLAYDNLSGMSAWLSDGLCILATGGAYTCRRLYSDDEETILRASRPVIVNGIDDMASRPDFADRAVMVTLPPIPREQRREERAFWRSFEAARPRLLGALFDLLSGILAARPNVRLSALPRMADFARWGVAVERALDWPAGSFLRAYQFNLAESAATALEADPVAGAIIQLLQNWPSGWEGTTGDLLQALERIVPLERRTRRWPNSPQALTNRIRRAAPVLRGEGIVAIQPPRTHRGALWSISKGPDAGESSSGSSTSGNAVAGQPLVPERNGPGPSLRDERPARHVTNHDEEPVRNPDFIPGDRSSEAGDVDEHDEGSSLEFEREEALASDTLGPMLNAAPWGEAPDDGEGSS